MLIWVCFNGKFCFHNGPDDYFTQSVFNYILNVMYEYVMKELSYCQKLLKNVVVLLYYYKCLAIMLKK